MQRIAACLAAVLAVVCGVAVVALHLVTPSAAPHARTLSEFVRGDTGWLFRTALAALACALVALAAAVGPAVPSVRTRRALRWALGVWALGCSLAAAAPIDPGGHMVSSGARVHVAGVVLGVLAAAAAAALLVSPLARRSPPLSVASSVVALGLLLLVPPAVPLVGLALVERLALLGVVGWVACVAVVLAQVRRPVDGRRSGR